MSWVKLDDGFPEHPKVLEAGPIASWLHVRAIAYCNRQLTDGFVSHAAVRHMNGAKSTATLVRVGLWESVKGGYQIHDYLEYQPSRAEVIDRRGKRVAAGRLGGVRSGELRRSKTEANGQASAQAFAEHGAEGLLQHVRSKTEPRPVPGPYPVPHHDSDAYQAPDPEIPDDPEPDRRSERARGREGLPHISGALARLAR